MWIRYRSAVRICGFHPQDRGSTPRIGMHISFIFAFFALAAAHTGSQGPTEDAYVIFSAIGGFSTKHIDCEFAPYTNSQLTKQAQNNANLSLDDFFPRKHEKFFVYATISTSKSKVRPSLTLQDPGLLYLQWLDSEPYSASNDEDTISPFTELLISSAKNHLIRSHRTNRHRLLTLIVTLIYLTSSSSQILTQIYPSLFSSFSKGNLTLHKSDNDQENKRAKHDCKDPHPSATRSNIFLRLFTKITVDCRNASNKNLSNHTQTDHEACILRSISTRNASFLKGTCIRIINCSQKIIKNTNHYI